MPTRFAPAGRRPGLAFWIHQVVEYLLGALVITQAIQAAQPVLVVLIGVGILALAATADGPLAAFHVVPRPLHRVLDLVAAVVIAVLAVVKRDALDPVGMAFALGAAAVLVFLAIRTDSRPPRRWGASREATDSDASPTGDAEGETSSASAPPSVPGATSADQASTSKGERYGRAAGRALGKGIRSYRDRPPPADPP